MVFPKASVSETLLPLASYVKVVVYPLGSLTLIRLILSSQSYVVVLL